MHPDAADDFAHADDAALVLLGNFYGTRVLLLSDLGRDGQSALLARTNDLRADIVIAGLPDEGEPLCDALLDAVQPKVIVVADSEFPATRRAEPRIEGTAGAKENSGDLHAHGRRGDNCCRDRTAGNCGRWTGKKFQIEPRPGIEPDHDHRCHQHNGRL